MTAWKYFAQRAREDRGSLPMVMLVGIVGMLVSALLVPMLISQDHATRFDTTRVQSLDGAQAGLDVVLGQIRTATDAQGAGDATELPCGPVDGTVDASGNIAYHVEVRYYLADPVAQPGANPMVCAPGYGTYDPTSGGVTPQYAQLTATGTGGAGNGASKGRTLVTTYRFKTNNTNIPGGVIRIFPASSAANPMCLDVGSAAPAVGTSVVLRSCSNTTPPAAQQVLVYRTDLTIQLLASVSTTYPDGLCLTYPSADGKNPTSGAAITLGACQPLGQPLWNQQWSFDDNGHFRASLSTSKNSPGTLSSLCMDTHDQSAGTAITLQSCANGTTDPRQAWIPSPSVGAGAAVAPDSGQWVNYYEFGRCLDVTNQDVNTKYLIDYPCKQNPYPNAVAWNQKFTGPVVPDGAASASGWIYTTKSGTKYCLTSPATADGLAVVSPCSASNTKQNWTVYNDDNSLPYAKKFTVVDSSGLCLGLGDPQGGMVWSSITVETCTGAPDQKWNADPSNPSVLNTREK